MTAKEKIRELDSLRLAPASKAAIVLLALGQRPCLELNIFHYNSPVLAIWNALSALRLHARAVPLYGADQERYAARMCLATNGIAIKRLHDLAKRPPTNSPRNDIVHQRYGELMGYPHSAIVAFMQGHLLRRDSYPQDMKQNLLLHFLLSEDCYDEESGMIRKHEHFLADCAPDILTAVKQTPCMI